MQYAHLNLRVPVDFKQRLIDHRKETGCPDSIFVRRVVEAALDKWKPTKPKRRKVAI